MATNYDLITSDRKVLIDLILNYNSWARQIDGEYCLKICPNRSGKECLCGDECDIPHTLEEIIDLWLKLETT